MGQTALRNIYSTWLLSISGRQKETEVLSNHFILLPGSNALTHEGVTPGPHQSTENCLAGAQNTVTCMVLV